MYVGLSRIRHIKNAFLIGDYNRAAIAVNATVEKEYPRLRKKFKLKLYQPHKSKRKN